MAQKRFPKLLPGPDISWGLLVTSQELCQTKTYIYNCSVLSTEINVPWIKLHTRSIFIYTPIKSTGNNDGRYSKGQIPDNRDQEPPLLLCHQSLPVSVIQEGTPQTTVHVPLMPSSRPLLLYIMQKQNPVFSHIGQAVSVGGIYSPSLHPPYLPDQLWYV